MLQKWLIVKVISGGAGIERKKDHLSTTDRMTWKIHGAPNPQGDLGKLYIPRNNRGREMISAPDCVEVEANCMRNCAKSRNERLLSVVDGQGILGVEKMKEEVLEVTRKNFMEKPLR